MDICVTHNEEKVHIKYDFFSPLPFVVGIAFRSVHFINATDFMSIFLLHSSRSFSSMKRKKWNF